jgi:hypothetical protein
MFSAFLHVRCAAAARFALSRWKDRQDETVGMRPPQQWNKKAKVCSRTNTEKVTPQKPAFSN